MKLCRFDADRLGLIRDGLVHDITDVLGRLGAYGYPLPSHDLLYAGLEDLRPHIEAAAVDARGIRVVVTQLPHPEALAEIGIEIHSRHACQPRLEAMSTRDDILITAGVPKNLSAAAPRTVEEIEAWMQGDKPDSCSVSGA